MDCGSAQVAMPARRPFLSTIVLLAALAAAGCREEGDIKIKSFKLVGVESIPKGALMNALQTKKGSRLPWGRKRYFDRRAFEADLQRLRAFYADRGFPDARVTSFDVKLSDTQDAVDLTVTISEGEPIRVAAIELHGFDVIDEKARRNLESTLPLQPDQPLDRQFALASRERALNVLKDEGYPYAEVSLAEEEAGPRRRKLTLRADPGPLARFGPIEINGNQSVDDYIIERQLTFKPGEIYKRREMRDSQRRLYRVELFEFANVESQEDRQQRPVDVPVRVTVAEGKHRKITTGIGYGTEEKARARVRWDHVNFFGGARHAGFEGKWSSLDRGVKVDFDQPYFWSPHFSLGLDGQAWQARERAYSLDSLGGRVVITHQANQQNQWSVGLTNEYQDSEVSDAALRDLSLRDELISLGLDPRSGVSRGTLSAVVFDISRNTTTSALDARSGYRLAGHVEQAGKWLWGSFNYYAVTLEGRHYLPIARKVVVANRLRVGSIDGLGGATQVSVPFYKRYFLGGASSVRGWGRFELSPLSGSGLPIGGHTMLEGSSELRLPLWGKIGAVAFLDYGNVWSESWNFDIGELRYAVGPGLRYVTPIGPARIDLGWQVNPLENLLVNGEPQRRRWRVHFSVGQAF
jgi:outer membrane protein assembly complex protein YaeT